MAQALPSGGETATPIAGGEVLGWTTGDGALLRQNLVDDANRYYTGTLVWVVARGAGAAELVETINLTSQDGQPLTLAPTAGD